MPIATFGTNFNYSIWYVEIRGIQDRNFMSRVYDAYECVSQSIYEKVFELKTFQYSLKKWKRFDYV